MIRTRILLVSLLCLPTFPSGAETPDPAITAPPAQTAAAASAPKESARNPDESAGATENPEPAAADATETPAAPAVARTRTRNFRPSEEISVDNSVPYPVDI